MNLLYDHLKVCDLGSGIAETGSGIAASGAGAAADTDFVAENAVGVA